MFALPKKFRSLVLVFALWLAFEPCMVTIVRAQDQTEGMPQPEISSDNIDGIDKIEDILTPVEYLEYMLTLRGLSKSEAEAKAWGDWLMTITGAYMMMDEGSHDVFTFYSAMKIFKSSVGQIKSTLQDFQKLTKKAALIFAFVARANVAIRGVNLFTGFKKVSDMVSRFNKMMESNTAFKFLSFMSPPPCWNNPKIAGEGFKSYYRWVLKKTTGGSGLGNGGTKGLPFGGEWDGGRYISDWKGAARTVGIGLTIIGIALDAYAIITSEDTAVGRFTYSLAKNAVGVLLGAATLVAMFCIPVVGQVIFAVTLAWTIITMIGDIIGAYNKKWHEAYKNSHWFLYQEDPEYRLFYDNRDLLKDEEKALSLKLAERDFKEALNDQPAPQSEDDEKTQERNRKVYETIEKQGVLVTYYSQTGFNMPDFDLNRLQELWRKKADFMAWKPNEAESEKAKNRGFWGTLGHVVNPMTYISWVGDKIQSQGYKREIENQDIERVYFNPDYVLLKKYKNYLLGRNLGEGIYDIVGLRIEQAPYNYLPLIGIESTAWTPELLEEAFNADALIVGSKELIYFREQVKMAHVNAKNLFDETKKTLKKIENDDLKFCSQLRDSLQSLVDAYKIDPERVHAGLEAKLSKAPLKWRIDKSRYEPTPRNYISRYKADIEQMLLYEPLSLAQKAADTVLIAMTVKQNIDTAELMKALSSEKHSVIDNFQAEFKNDAIKKYLEKGEFLNVNGSWWDKTMNWLSEIYPAYDELKKYTKLYDNEVDSFVKTSDAGNIKHNPAELLRKLNNELEAYKDLFSDFEDIKDDAGIKMPLSEDREKYNGVFARFQIPDGIEEMTPLDPDMILPDLSDSPVPAQ